MDMIKSRIASIKDEARMRYPKKIFNNREDEVNHYNLAVDQAMEIVRSLEARFITGTSDSEPRGYIGKGVIYHYDSLLFEEEA